MFDTLLPYLLAGVSVGGQYALIAVGYTLVYGILRLINFGEKRKRPERIRLRTVILNLMYVAAIDGRHGGRKHLRLGRNCHQAKTFLAVLQRLAA